MIMINEEDDVGGKSFANEILKAIRPTLVKHFDKEAVIDFDNEEKFYGFVLLLFWSEKEFNIIAKAMINANVASPYMPILMQKLKSDPRYTP